MLLTHIYCTDEETLYRVLIMPTTNFMEGFVKFVNIVHNGYYKVDFFELIQLGNKPFYVKKYVNSNKIDIECSPKKLIMQCMKYYENREINEIDMKFIDETGCVATYDTDVFHREVA